MPCALARVVFRLLASFLSLAPIIQANYTFHPLVLLSDVLTGAWDVGCGLVAMVTSLITAEENAASTLATFTAPSLLFIGIYSTLMNIIWPPSTRFFVLGPASTLRISMIL